MGNLDHYSDDDCRAALEVIWETVEGEEYEDSSGNGCSLEENVGHALHVRDKQIAQLQAENAALRRERDEAQAGERVQADRADDNWEAYKHAEADRDRLAARCEELEARDNSIRRHLDGHADSKLDGPNGLAAATMRELRLRRQTHDLVLEALGIDEAPLDGGAEVPVLVAELRSTTRVQYGQLQKSREQVEELRRERDENRRRARGLAMLGHAIERRSMQRIRETFGGNTPEEWCAEADLLSGLIADHDRLEEEARDAVILLGYEDPQGNPDGPQSVLQAAKAAVAERDRLAARCEELEAENERIRKSKLLEAGRRAERLAVIHLHDAEAKVERLALRAETAEARARELEAQVSGLEDAVLDRTAGAGASTRALERAEARVWELEAKAEAWDLLDSLLQRECASVEVYHHNPEFDGPNNVVTYRYTIDGVEHDYCGDSVAHCLEQIKVALAQADGEVD